MKKFILPLIIIGAFATNGFSQSKILLPRQLYADMKAKGELKAGTEYVIINDTKTEENISSKVTQQQLSDMHLKSVPSTTCSCIVPLDTSFHVAEFVGYTAPNYRNDDASTAVKTLPFNFCLYGTNYNQLYINNNGNVSFGSSYTTFTASGFPDPTYIMVAPFWGDVDTRAATSGVVYYKITPTYMIVKWDNVGYYNSHVDKKNNFQLIISNGSDPIIPNGNNVAFCYGDMQWTTGDASSGVGGFGGTPATVGINKGDGVNYIQMGRFDQAGIAYDGGYGANDGVSWLDNQSLYFNACNSTNIPPIASGLNNCDTIKICALGDTLILNGLFLAPEVGQNTTIAVDLHGTPGATVLSNTPGNSASSDVQIIASPANAGNNMITFTATDNGSPAGITVINVNIFVDTTGLFAFNPVITGPLDFCSGGSTTLSVTPGTLDGYTWSTGSTSPSITVDSTGHFWVTSRQAGCYKTSSVDVTEHPKPTPLILGAGCANPATGTAGLYSDSLLYVTYTWTGGTHNDSLSAGPGSYTLTVVDSNGCTATSPPVSVFLPVVPVITGTAALCNGAPAVLTTATPYSSYSWSNASTTPSVTVGTGTYTVSTTDAHGCVTTSAPVTINIFNYGLTTTGVGPYCMNDSLLLTALSASSPAATPGYVWSDGDHTATTYVNTGGSYTVTVTYPNGCSADTTITVPAPSPLPTPVILGTFITCSSTNIYVDSAALYTNFVWSNGNTNDTVATGGGTFTVTVTGSNGCLGTSPGITVVDANPVVNITGVSSFCPGDSTVLTANIVVPTTGTPSYSWSTSATTPSITAHGSGDYIVTVTYPNGCGDTDTMSVLQFAGPQANFTETPAGSANLGTPTQFSDLSTIASGTITNWLWDFGDSAASFNQNPVHQYGDNGTYHVTLAVQSSNGCWDTVSYDYNIYSDVQVPNVITPNGDGKNDYLVFKNLEFFPGSSLVVYNRWGNKVYETSYYKNDWGGDNRNDGVYYFVLSGPLLKEAKTGFVQVLQEK